MNKGLGRLRAVAVWVLGSIVTMAMVVSFVESYHGLYLWASRHKVTGVFAYSWPIMVDAFLLSGEIVLLTSAIGGWPKRTRTLGWFMSLGGLTASVLANAGQVGSQAAITDHITGAVPPLAAFASMVAALSLIKQTVATAHVVEEIAETVQVEPDEPMRVVDYTDPLHEEIEALNALPSNAARVRAAIGAHPKGLYAQPAEINEWLKDRDQEVPITTVNTTLSRERAKNKPVEEAEEITADSSSSEGLAAAAVSASPVDASVKAGDIPAGQRRLSRV